MAEPENMVLRLLQEMRADMATREDIAQIRSEIADVRSDIGDVRAEVGSLRADVASDLVLLEMRLGDQIATLRRSVMEYHSTTIGHGVLYSEIEDRVRRIEQHLNLPPTGAH